MKGSGGAGASASRTASRTAPRVEESFAFAGSKVEEAMELEARGASAAEACTGFWRGEVWAVEPKRAVTRNGRREERGRVIGERTADKTWPLR